MNDIRLTGLDGMNPLGFMAALGLLRVLHERAPDTSPRLGWVEAGRWTAVLRVEAEVDPVAVVMEELEAWRGGAPELALAYKPKGGRESIRDLKPPPEDWAEYVRTASEQALAGERRLPGFAAAFAPGLAMDHSGYTKPTAFHFTAGQQKFVEMVAQILEKLTVDDVREALFGPWQYQRDLPVLRWDVRGERLHALLPFDPSKEKTLGVPGADWLAFLGLPLFPTAPTQRPGARVRAATTAFEHDREGDALVWPLWEPPASLAAVRSLLSASGLRRLSAKGREAYGVTAVLCSRVRRSEQGGYGSFGAPEVLPPEGR